MIRRPAIAAFSGATHVCSIECKQNSPIKGLVPRMRLNGFNAGTLPNATAIVKQSSLQTFLQFASHEAYLEGMGHRTAALEDSRLLPIVEFTS